MRDDPCSAYVRAEKDLPDNWRVYQWEAVGSDRVRVTGSLVRRADPIHEKHLHRDFDWIRPLQCRVQMTMTQSVYSALYDKKDQPHD